MDSEKEKNRLSDIVLERVGLTGTISESRFFSFSESIVLKS